MHVGVSGEDSTARSIGASTRRGVRTSVSQLYELHAHDVRRFLRRRSGCAATAEDLTQETFVRLMNVATLDDVNNMRSYLFRIASNLLIDHQRMRSAKSQPREIVELERAYDLRDEAPGADVLLLQRDQLRQVGAFLGELPASCREIFWLSRIVGMANHEIAERRGVCLSTVEKNISSATRHCKARTAEASWREAERPAYGIGGTVTSSS